MKLQEEEEQHARLEMTPIMDVVFLLIVFFVYAFMSMTVQRGVRVELPRADGSVSRGDSIQLVLNDADEVFLDGRIAMTRRAAVDSAALRAKETGLPVVIRTDRQAHAGPALELMADLRAKGVSKVTYQVEKGD